MVECINDYKALIGGFVMFWDMSERNKKGLYIGFRNNDLEAMYVSDNLVFKARIPIGVFGNYVDGLNRTKEGALLDLARSLARHKIIVEEGKVVFDRFDTNNPIKFLDRYKFPKPLDCSERGLDCDEWRCLSFAASYFYRCERE